MNLLTDPLIPVFTSQGREYRSLPGLLAGLGDDTVQRIDGLQRHQEDAFHVFLCYLAGAVLARDGDWNPVRKETFWRDGLRLLAGEAGDDAWSLVVDDLSKPAFMQPPQISILRDEVKWSSFADAADQIDATELAKNHDVKKGRAINSTPYEWMYALVSGNFNTGYSKGGREGFYFPSIKAQKNRIGRVYVYPIAGNSVASSWRLNVSLLNKWQEKCADSPLFDTNGLVLTWLRAWDREPFKTGEISPFFVETTRMVRLQLLCEGCIAAQVRPTKSEPFMAQKELQGRVPDPFIPTDSDQKAISAKSGRWPVEQIYRVIFQKEGVSWPFLEFFLGAGKGGEDNRISFGSMARSKNGTEGYVTQVIHIPHQKMLLFRSRSQREQIADLGKEALEAAKRMQSNVLYPALVKLVESAPRKERKPRDAEKLWINRVTKLYDSQWGDTYFQWLMNIAEPLEKNKERLRWVLILRDIAQHCLDRAEDELPERSARHWRARALARSTFNNYLTSAKNFPDLKEAHHEHIA